MNMKVICTCNETNHFDYALVSTYDWILAKIKFFQSLNLRAKITVAVDDVRILEIYTVDTNVEFEDVHDNYLDINHEIKNYVLHEA